MAIKKDNIVDKINLDDRQDVYLTKKAHTVQTGRRKEGEKVSLHPKQAEEWIKSGRATEEPATPVKAEAKK